MEIEKLGGWVRRRGRAYRMDEGAGLHRRGGGSGMKRLIPAMLIISTLSANAAFAYDANWQVDESGNWSYIMDDGTKAANAWIHDNSDSQWYLLDENGTMRTGLFASSGRYYLLDTVRGTGTYGKLLKNGDSYNGVAIQADTSAEYEGALSDATLAQLESQGVSKDAAPNVSNTQHISNGMVTSAGDGGVTNDTTNSSTEDSSLDTSNSVVVRGVTYHKPANVSQEDWDSANDDEKVLLSYGSTMESIRRMNELQRNTVYKNL